MKPKHKKSHVLTTRLYSYSINDAGSQLTANLKENWHSTCDTYCVCKLGQVDSNRSLSVVLGVAGCVEDSGSASQGGFLAVEGLSGKQTGSSLL